MNSIFRELLYEGVLANYIDDFIIPVRTMQELEERMIRFLKIAEKHNLCFKRSKYDFNMEEIPILGVVVGKRQVQMEQDKIKVVKERKMPMKIKKVESFLEFANFYKRFIQNFSYIAKPLNKVERKEGKSMDRGIPTGIQGIKRKDNKSTCTFPSKKRR